MTKIKVKELEPGMTLSADVHDQHGRFLLGKDCQLTEKHLQVLNAWGVISIEVVGENLSINPGLNDVSSENYQAIDEQVKTRFVHNDMNHPFIKELVSETTRFMAEHFKE